MAKRPAIVIPDGLSTVLLHACCAPCSSAIVEWLLAHDIRPTIYYFNPNIYPAEEYLIRKSESQRHAESLGIKWLDDDYNHATWRQSVCGHETDPERGARCELCFRHRLLATARKAQELGIPYFATTLASSRWKNLDQINAAGVWAENEVRTINHRASMHDSASSPSPVFWAQNWRKDGLQQRRNELLHEYNFYNQLYCGCEFSMPKQ